jgi:alpha-1,3/alpha-1,6-mannosyltransferase
LVPIDLLLSYGKKPTHFPLAQPLEKNISLAISVFAQFRQGLTAADKNTRKLDTARIVIGGGYDPRLKDNIDALDELVSLSKSLNLSYSLITSLESPRLEAIKTKSIPPS